MAITWYVFVQWIHKRIPLFPLSGVTWDILGHISTLLSFHLTWKKLESPVTRSTRCLPSIISPPCVAESHEGPGLSRQMKSYESQREQKISAVQCSSGAGVLKEQVAWPGLLGEPPRPWLVNGSHNVLILYIWMPPVFVYILLLLISLRLKYK